MLRSTTLAAALLLASGAMAAETLDATPRIAVVSAFGPEWTALQGALTDRKDDTVNGTVFATGSLEGKPVVLFLSGVSMVNAAMTSQLALDSFAIDRIVFSGIAGGVDPALSIGDVVVPDQWGQYLEMIFAREVDGKFVPPSFLTPAFAGYGMMVPSHVSVDRDGQEAEPKFWFPVDSVMLEVAKAVAGSIDLKDCAAADACLTKDPSVVIGGNGVSGSAFVDNAAFRDYVSATFDAKVLDMESAAVAHVAYANNVPFIAFRSLSDLAGGGEGENEMGTFFQLAADNSASVVRAFVKALP